MHLHFICTGNVFRSRLAEAYARSHSSDLQITSSGILASNNEDGPIAWYALKLIKDNDLIPYISPAWTQTSTELLHLQDFVVFMQPYHLDVCQQLYGYHGHNHQVWDIADVTPKMSDRDLIFFSLNQFGQIRQQVDQLLVNLQHS